jgi:ABC-2 type transport system ATP-binding protein
LIEISEEEVAQTVLSVRNLKKSFRKKLTAKPVEALKGVSFEIAPGTITGFLGANGAGKTTTIKCLLNLAFADSGEITYFGEPELSSKVKSRIGFLPERPYFYEYLTGREFLRFYGQLSGRVPRKDLGAKIEKLLKRVSLEHAGDRQLRSYSKGMLQRIGIAQTLIHSPEFIILDEPMTGLDPDGRMEVQEIIQETANEGTAVFFSSHLLPDAERLCERLVILKQGNLVFEGRTTELLGRVDSGYAVSYLESGKLLTESVPAGDHAVATSPGPSPTEKLQVLIDRLRLSGAVITEIKQKRLTLEEAFVKIAFDGKEGRQ